MARAVLPNPSARAEWLFAGIIDRALHHWGHVPALDGGPGCSTLTSTVPTLTRHFLTTMTTSPSRVSRRKPCSLPVSGRSVFLCVAPCGAPLLFLRQ